MSFAVSLENPDLEWAGSSLATVFGQKRNLVRPRLLAHALRTSCASTARAWPGWLPIRTTSARCAISCAKGATPTPSPTGTCCRWRRRSGRARPARCSTTPLATFVRFCSQPRPAAGLRPAAVADGTGRRPRVREEDRRATRRHPPGLPGQRRPPRSAAHLHVTHAGGSETFDQVVMACHSDQALAILGFSASDAQRDVLGGHPLPAQPRRAAHRPRPAAARREALVGVELLRRQRRTGYAAGRVSYLINQLQPLPFKTPVVVTLNPAREPDPAKVIAEFDYAHPIFDGPAIAAQRRLAERAGRPRHLVWRRLGRLRLPRGRPEFGAARGQWPWRASPMAGRARSRRRTPGNGLRRS